MAEVLLKRELESLGRRDVAVASAGLYAYPGHPPDPRMVEYLAESGVAYEPHEARGMTREDGEWADRIVVMEKDHKRAIAQVWPGTEAKVELLSRYLSGDWADDDVPDPYGKSPYHYRAVQSQIRLAVQNLALWIGENA